MLSKPSTLTAYDILGRPLVVTATDGNTTAYTYTDLQATHGFQTTVVDARQNATISKTDVWGRTDLVTPAAGPSVDYVYNEADQLPSAARGGATTTITYDKAGRKIALDDPDMGDWSYGYDALGNLTSQTDAKGCIATLSYDALNRLTGKTYNL